MTEDDARKAIDTLLRGTVDVVSREELESKLRKAEADGRPLRVKLGVDPTSTDLHLGHTVPLRKLRTFQDAGHKAVLIIGDYTAQVGDPSGQNATRPVLTEEQVRANAQTYLDQVDRVLDRSPDKLELVYNGDWFRPMGFMDVIRLAARTTVARMLERDDFSNRYKQGTPIGLHEFMYPLMQGYDSVAVRADVELGGTDQLFNLLVGRDLQRDAGQEPQVCITLPLLVGTDGVKKMSKSYGNAVPIAGAPEDMYGKLMSLQDEQMHSYYVLMTSVPQDQIEDLCDPGHTHPRQAKAHLALEVTRGYHGEEAARAAQAAFDRQFKDKRLPEDIPECALAGDAVWIVDALRAAGLAGSGGDARRKIEQNGVRRIAPGDGGSYEEDTMDVDARVEPAGRPILRVGRRFVRFVPAE